jgi:hypothetical protein
MNCAQARPLLLAGDPAADGHLEGCAACGVWLEKHDPLVKQFRAARPAALPAPAGLSRRVLGRWTPARPGWRRWVVPAGLAAATLVLVLAAGIALATQRADLLASAAVSFQPLLNAYVGPRDLLLGNLAGLVGLAGLAVLSFAIGGVLYRELGRTPRGLAQ